MKKSLETILLLLIIQGICFVCPVIIYKDYLICIGFIVNVILSWILIKRVEKMYYPKYNKINSMLYMICPVIGVSLISFIIYLITKETFIMRYYIILVSAIYGANLVYILYNYIKNK